MAEGDLKSSINWVELAKVVALPLVTLVVGYLFNSSLNTRQERDNKIHLYADMMGRREEADSSLRKDMFKSILDTFLKPGAARPEQLETKVLNIELLAYNFHESLDLGPLFKHVRRELETAHSDENLLWRLERVAQEVKGRQLAVLADSGMVETGELVLPPAEGDPPEGALAWRMGKSMIQLKPTQRVRGPTLCMAIRGDGEMLYRQFKIVFNDYLPERREVQLSLAVSKPLKKEECSRLLDAAEDNIETKATFWAGLFAFPMIDNTRLTHSERCSVSVNSIESGVAKVSVAYFPASRASLKDKMYYDEVLHDLLNGSGPRELKER